MDRKKRGINIRELAGFVLLAGLLLAGFLLSWYLGRQYPVVSGALEDSAWMALSGQWEKARQNAADAKAQWEKSWKLQATFADHNPMEEIDSLFAELTVLGVTEQREEFARLCRALSCRMEDMADAQRLSWWNVL